MNLSSFPGSKGPNDLILTDVGSRVLLKRLKTCFLEYKCPQNIENMEVAKGNWGNIEMSPKKKNSIVSLKSLLVIRISCKESF